MGAGGAEQPCVESGDEVSDAAGRFPLGSQSYMTGQSPGGRSADEHCGNVRGILNGEPSIDLARDGFGLWRRYGRGGAAAARRSGREPGT